MPEGDLTEFSDDADSDRQDAVEEAAEKGVEQFDLTAGMDFDVEPEDITDLASALQEAKDFDVEDAESEQLAEYVAALKELEDAAEDARKDVFEEALDERDDVGDEIGGLVRGSGSSRFVYDDDELVDAIEEAGGDPSQAMTVKASDAADVLEALGLDPDEHIGRKEYTYWRRR